MAFGYIETEDICHLDRTDERSFHDLNWRESYYFNMTDPRSGISLITTLGLVPNKKRKAGFVLITKDRRTMLFRPVASMGKPAFSDWCFSSHGLSYSVEGANWRIAYSSKKVSLDLLFTPLNKIFPYTNGKTPIDRVATQHYEQSGMFEGEVRIRDKVMTIGPCFGHRDHSWGVRDWGGIDAYTLLSCTFSRDLAVNIWKSSVNGNTILNGYIFDGEGNERIASAVIDPYFSIRGSPVSATIEIVDEKGREYQIGARVESDHLFPPPGSLVHETIAEMRMGELRGHGLLEFLEHTNRPRRIGAAIGSILRMGVAECR